MTTDELRAIAERATACSMCGSAVTIYTGGEGTSSYEPLLTLPVFLAMLDVIEAAEAVDALVNDGRETDLGWTDEETGEWVSQPSTVYPFVGRKSEVAVSLRGSLARLKEMER